MGRGGRRISERLCCVISIIIYKLMTGKKCFELSLSKSSSWDRQDHNWAHSRKCLVELQVHTNDHVPNHFQAAPLFGLTAKHEVSSPPDDLPSVLILCLELMTLLP